MTEGKTAGRPWRRGAGEPQPGYDDGCAVDDLRVRVPALATELRPLRQALSEWARRTPLRPEQVENLRLVCDEAAANVVEHAYATNHTGLLNLDATCSVKRGVVTVTVTDQGHWRRPTLDPHSMRGRGLQLIRAMTDSVHVHTGQTGTTVRMTWNLDQGGAVGEVGRSR
jgi:serine/threonine-protein kinase RsbW